MSTDLVNTVLGQRPNGSTAEAFTRTLAGSLVECPV